jgi:hypothetical protein
MYSKKLMMRVMDCSSGRPIAIALVPTRQQTRTIRFRPLPSNNSSIATTDDARDSTDPGPYKVGHLVTVASAPA